METIKAMYNSKAVRLRERLLADIRSAEYQPGTLLPAEDKLAEKYGVSRATMYRAVSGLIETGALLKRSQRGVWVPLNVEAGKAELSEGKDLGGREVRAAPAKLTIAAVWATESDFRIVKMREGIGRYAREAGLNFQMYLSSQGHAQALEILSNLEQCEVDGVILLPYPHESYRSVLGRLSEKGFPMVCVRSIDGVPISSVETDSFGSGYQATHYLIEKYGRPVYCLTPPTEETNTRDRVAGFGQAMSDAGYDRAAVERHTVFLDLSIYDPSSWPMDKNWVPGYQAARKLLAGAEFPVSIVCINDYIGKGVYEAAAECGRIIGKDIYVVGIDDLPLARLLSPSLTTIRSPKEEVGYEAARVLHGLMQKKAQPIRHIHLPVELVVRESA